MSFMKIGDLNDFSKPGIYLRILREEDLSTLKEIRDLNLRFLHTQVSFSDKETKRWFKKLKDKWYTINLFDAQNSIDQMIGYIRIDYRENELYIGADIHPDYQHKGYGRQAYNTLFRLLGKPWGNPIYTNEVFLEVLEDNTNAIGFYESMGFEKLSVSRIGEKNSIKMKKRL